MIKFTHLYTQETATVEQGRLCLFERGGGYSNTGTARLIADGHGMPKTAAHIRTRGDLACGDHAAIPVDVGDYVIEVTRHHDSISVAVGYISDISGDIVTIKSSKGEETVLGNMIDAGIAKSYDYHCRRPHYIR